MLPPTHGLVDEETRLNGRVVVANSTRPIQSSAKCRWRRLQNPYFKPSSAAAMVRTFPYSGDALSIY